MILRPVFSKFTFHVMAAERVLEPLIKLGGGD